MRVSIGLVLAWLMVLVVRSDAQEPSPKVFEVVSVRESVSSSGAGTRQFLRGGRLVIENMTLEELIRIAYRLGRDPIRFEGQSENVQTRRFSINAVPSESRGLVTAADHPDMLKAILTDRFRLTTHVEVEQAPIYALTVAKFGQFGPKLRESQVDCTLGLKSLEATGIPNVASICAGPLGIVRGGVRQRFSGPLSILIRHVQGYVKDRQIVDLTGLTGMYEWDLTFASDLAPVPDPDSGPPSIYTAFAEQLGLKLEPRMGPMPTLVVDSVQMPTPN